ncbi:MAG: DNA glycosylase [Clostridia bacterium]|nr:DNA glycosylase [Clostridia bacterium]
MIYKIEKNVIIITDKSQFDINHILKCGQIFRYKIEDGIATVFSLDKKAVVKTENGQTKIISSDLEYFVNFFDLNNNYTNVYNELTKFEFLKESIIFGKGLRILKQDLLESMVSFIISANNNIKRITNSLFYICEHLGQKVDDYYAFPTLKALKTASIEFFTIAGLGYRAKQLYATLQKLDANCLNDFIKMDFAQKQKWLISLSGIGEKVSDCILLFGDNQKYVFPVDTWIEKVYKNNFAQISAKNRFEMRKNLIKIFGEYSGLAQQFLFYYYRENNKKLLSK